MLVYHFWNKLVSIIVLGIKSLLDVKHYQDCTTYQTAKPDRISFEKELYLLSHYWEGVGKN